MICNKPTCTESDCECFKPYSLPPVSSMIRFFALGVIIGLLAGLSWHWHTSSRVTMSTLKEVKRQCDSEFPLLLDGTFYKCEKLYDSER